MCAATPTDLNISTEGLNEEQAAALTTAVVAVKKKAESKPKAKRKAAKTPSQKPQTCGFSVKAVTAAIVLSMAEVEVPKVKIDLEDGKVRKTQIATIRSFCHEVQGLRERQSGLHYWLLGRALQLLRPLPKTGETDKNLWIPKREWSHFLKSIGLSQDQSERYRRIAVAFSRKQAESMSQNKMLEILAGRKDEEDGSGGTGGGEGDNGDNGDNGTTVKGVKKYVETWADKIAKDFIPNLPTTDDLKNDADEKLAILTDDFPTALDGLELQIKELRKAGKDAREVCKTFIAEREKIIDAADAV